VPKHVDNDTLMVTMAILQCQQGTFPQTYLGRPLSNTKLRLSAFAPLIAKTDRYLAGWKATLLTPAGRVTLINAVLDGLPLMLWGPCCCRSGSNTPWTHAAERSCELARTRPRARGVLWHGKTSARPKKTAV
jgi:hypothetical protein